MRKLRNDSSWNRLTYEQRDTLESWLFDENLGYAKIVARAQKEFGLQFTIASLSRYYRRRARERQNVELDQAQRTADQLNALPVSVASLRQAAIKLAGTAILKLAAEKPGQPQLWVPLTNLLLESERNDIRRSRLKLAERYFHYEAIAASQKELPRVRSYLTTIWHDPDHTEDEKIAATADVFFGGHHSVPSASEPDEPRNGT